MSGGAGRLFRFLFRGFTRKKIVVDGEQTDLKRCLGLVDLTALGIGSTLGAGIYVVAGRVAKDTSGPAVCVAFLIAALASLFSALCYAEFGSRVPKSGSAYVYSYVSIGELMAFIIGWNLILEYVIGTASVARAWTANFDSLIGGHYSKYMRTHLSMSISGLGGYPDFFAVGLVFLLTVIIAVGVKESSVFNNIFTIINLFVIAFIFICGLFKADFDNWNIDPEGLNVSSAAIGSGGFVPFGVQGIFSGAGSCFFAFIGFDVIATAGEEVRRPQRNIPIAIMLCLLACCVAYFCISAIVTLMWPFYLLDGDAPLPFVFDRAGWPVAKYAIAVGSLCGLSTSMFGGLFPLPRIIYAMASDGLLFRFFAHVNRRFKTPMVSCIFSGCLSAIMACLFDIKELVDMMSIGTLLAYSLVSVSILRLRGAYVPPQQSRTDEQSESGESRSSSSTLKVTEYGAFDEALQECCQVVNARNILRHLFVRHNSYATPVSGRITAYAAYGLLAMSMTVAVILHYWQNIENIGYVIGLSFAIICELLLFIILAIQPNNLRPVAFKVPLTPWLPGLGLLINLYLMVNLSEPTWIRFAVWMAIGFIIYFGYGIRHSGTASSVPFEEM